jgi:hypothetical protein
VAIIQPPVPHEKRCAICKLENWTSRHWVAYENAVLSPNTYSYTTLPDGRDVCLNCLRCRQCYGVLKNPSRRKTRFGGSLVSRCDTCHNRASRLRHDLIRKRSFSENNVPGKPLKTLLKMGKVGFRKIGGAVLRSVDGEREAEVMFFHDTAAKTLVRMTQFSKATRVGRGGKLVREFDRRTTVLIQYHQDLNSDLYTLIRDAYTDRMIDALRGRDYRVIERINASGRHDSRMPYEYHETKKEWEAKLAKQNLDKNLGDTHRDTLRDIDSKHRERQRRVGWVEEQ